MPINDSALIKDENGNVAVEPIRSIALPQGVVTLRFPDPPFAPGLGRLLPTQAVIPLYLECTPQTSPNDEGVLQLSLSPTLAQQLLNRLSAILAEYTPEDDGPQSVN